MKSYYFKFQPIIGVGYWFDDYNNLLPGAYAHNIILPFFRIQISFIPTL